jgi:hypothetical protein
MTQPTLFDRPTTAPHNGTATSLAAAIGAEPGKGTQARRVYELIEGCGSYGATRHEIAATLRIPLSSVCARVGEKPDGLLHVGLVVEQGERPGPYERDGKPVMAAVLVAKKFVQGGAK